MYSAFRQLRFPLAGLFLLSFLESLNLTSHIPDKGWIAVQFRDAIPALLKLSFGILFGIFINRVITVAIWDGLARKALGKAIPKLVKDISTTVIYLVTCAVTVSVVFNKSLSGLWATSGVLGIVLGMALRGMISDICTGLANHIDESFKIGDWVMVHDTKDQGMVGKILEINWRTTRIRTEDNNMVLIPNSVMGTKTITVFSGPTEESRGEVFVLIDFSIPVERAKRILYGAVKSAIAEGGFLENPEPYVFVSQQTQQGIEYRITFWTKPWDPLPPPRARDRVLSQVMNHMKFAGISPAFMKQDLFIARMPERNFDIISEKDSTELLRRNPLFQVLNPSDLQQLAKKMQTRMVKTGGIIIRKGEAGNSMFILIEGLIEIIDESKPGGERLFVLTPGAYVGEMSMLTGEPRSATVRALSECIFYEIGTQAMHELFQSRPELMLSISKVAAERRVATNQALEKLSVAEIAAHTESLSHQIFAKIKSFFFSFKEDQKKAG